MWMRPPSPIVQTPSSNIHLQKMPDHELREIKASDGQAPNIRTQLKHTDDRSWGKGNSPFAGSTSQQSPDLVTPRLDWGSNVYTRKHVHPVNFTGTVKTTILDPQNGRHFGCKEVTHAFLIAPKAASAWFLLVKLWTKASMARSGNLERRPVVSKFWACFWAVELVTSFQQHL